jgi:hypothetical protein
MRERKKVSEKLSDAAIKSNMAYYNALWKQYLKKAREVGDLHNRCWDMLHKK